MNDKAGSEQGKKHLKRLETFLDVVYALLFFRILHYLPHSEDMAWADKPLGLLSLLWANADELLRIIVGMGLTIIYWNLNNKLFGSLVRTNGRHAILALLQMFFVCLFIYFATVLRPEYFVMLLPKNEYFTTLDWPFNFFLIFFSS